MKQKITKNLVGDIDFEQPVDKIINKLQLLKELYPSYDLFIDTEYYGDWRTWVLKGTREETDVEYKLRINQESKLF